jgi:hypothetical protein
MQCTHHPLSFDWVVAQTNSSSSSIKLKPDSTKELKSNSNQTQIKLKPNSNQTQIKLKPNSNQTQTKLKPNSNQTLVA